MDTQVIFNIAISISGGLALWVLNSLTQRLQKMEDALAALKDELPKEYVQKLDYKDDIREVKEILRQIFDKLDNKQDKAT
jgi:RPA family protein